MVLHITEVDVEDVEAGFTALTEKGRKVVQNAQAIDNLRAKIRMLAASVDCKVDFRMRLNVDTFDIGIKEQPGTGHFFKPARAEEGGARRCSRGGAREGRVGSEERGVPETRQCGYRATPRYHAKTSNHPSPPHRRAACRRRCRRAGALMQR